MATRIFTFGCPVIANCGTRKNPEWITGEVVETAWYMGEQRYCVKLVQCDKDGKDVYWFPGSLLIADTVRNRLRKGVANHA